MHAPEEHDLVEHADAVGREAREPLDRLAAVERLVEEGERTAPDQHGADVPARAGWLDAAVLVEALHVPDHGS